MRGITVIGNWKMHGNVKSIHALLTGIIQRESQIGESTTVAVCPPATYLHHVSEQLRDTSIKWGGQNVNDKAEGALTGEISLQMLEDFSCHYVIVGHSERRTFFNERDEDVCQKLRAAVKSKITPILCVGETAVERENELTETVILRQLATTIEQISIDLWSKVVIAYEPLWAVGTGVSATPSQAQEVHCLIRQRLSQFNSAAAEGMTILYGGSVKASNAKALFDMSDIDGALVGGASLNSEEFLGICAAY